MLKRIKNDLKTISDEIAHKMEQKAWSNAIKNYQMLHERFLKERLDLEAILSLVSISALQEKQDQIEKAAETMLKAAEEFESIKKPGYAFKAYQRTVGLMKSSNRTEMIEGLEKKIESLGMLDMIIIVDTTGSMGSVLDAIKKEISNMLYYLSNKIPGIRIGALAYRDHCDAESSYLLQPHPFTESKDNAELISFIKEWRADGGGDIPEAVEDALHHLANFKWEMDKKVAILIADACPHEKEECQKKLDWKQETRKIAEEEIRVYTIQSGSDTKTKEIFGKIAQMTQGEYFNLEEVPHLPDLIVAIALHQVDLVEDFILDLEAKGQLPDSKKKLLNKFRR